jgi:pimeloyl-ACP methyl ester carboxylesterase
MSYEPRRIPWHEELDVRGVRHRLTWWGERTDTPIVLLHGFMDCAATWQFLADCLPPSWSCVAPDWRGFGGSAWAPGGYWFPDYFADLEVLLERLVPANRARVIGHSMGANVAMMYGGIRPKRLAWLVNLEGLGLARTLPEEAPKHYARWLDELRQPPRASRYDSVAQLASVLRTRNPRLTEDRAEFISRAWSGPLADGGVRAIFDPAHRLVNPVLYRREEAEACWAHLEIPVLLIMGERSELRTRHGHLASEHLRSCRDLRIINVSGVGHMMHHEDPEAIARHLVDFERSCPPDLSSTP